MKRIFGLLAVLALACAPLPGQTTVAVVGTPVTYNANSGLASPYTKSYTFSSTSNVVLVLSYYRDGSSNSITSVTVGSNTATSIAGQYFVSGYNQYLQPFCAAVPATGSQNISITYTTTPSSGQGMTILELSGTSCSAIDGLRVVNNSGGTAGTNWSTPAISVANSNELVVAWGGSTLTQANAAATPGSGFTWIDPPSPSILMTEYGIFSTPVTPTITVPTSANWAMAALAMSPTVQTCSQPVFSVAAGTYYDIQSVGITDGCNVICYTLDGTTPTATTPGTCSNGYAYGGALPIQATNTTLEAIGTQSGKNNSAITSATYILQAPTPVISPPAGAYSSVQTITITDSSAYGPVIHFTLDGSTPTCSSPTYSGPFVVGSIETVSAIACVSNSSEQFTPSQVAVSQYTVNTGLPTGNSIATIEFSGAGGPITLQPNFDGKPIQITGITVSTPYLMTGCTISPVVSFYNGGPYGSGADFLNLTLTDNPTAALSWSAPGVPFTLYPGTYPQIYVYATAGTGCANNFPLTVSLMYQPAQSYISVTPYGANFGNQPLGIASKPQAITISSVGTLPLTVSAIGVSDGTNFSIPSQGGSIGVSGSCNGQYSSADTCIAYVTFHPTALGAYAGSLIIVSNDARYPTLSIPLTGTGVLPTATAQTSPTNLNFGNQPINFQTPAQVVTLTNAGTALMNISSVSIDDTTDFAYTTNCGTTLNVGQSCTISVVFTPSAVQAVTGGITITTNDPVNPSLTVGLAGNGVNLWSSVGAQHIIDAGSNPLVSGQLCVLGTNSNNQAINFRAGSGGTVIARPLCTTITNGAISNFFVPDSADTSPSNVTYQLTVTDKATGKIVVSYSGVYITGQTWSLDNYQPAPGSVSLNYGYIPPGGAAGQVPIKLSQSNFDVGWTNIGNVGLPASPTFVGTLTAAGINTTSTSGIAGHYAYGAGSANAAVAGYAGFEADTSYATPYYIKLPNGLGTGMLKLMADSNAQTFDLADAAAADVAALWAGGSCGTAFMKGDGTCGAATGSTTVNGQSCALSGSCTVTAASIGVTQTAGVGGVTANFLASKDTSSPTRYVLPSSGACGFGIAGATVTAGNTFALYNVSGSVLTMVADGTITAGHILTGGTTTPGRVADTGQTSRSSVARTTCIVGVAQASATVGQNVAVIYEGPGSFGSSITGTIVTSIPFPQKSTTITSSMMLFEMPIGMPLTIPTNGTSGNCTSQMRLGTLPTASWTATVYQVPGTTAGRGTPASIGTVTVSTTGAQTWSLTQTSFNSGDFLQIVAPSTVDATAAAPELALCVIQ